jgi:hypothetical protein
MNEGAFSLMDHVLPETPIRQFVLTMPFPLRLPLAFVLDPDDRPVVKGNLCGQHAGFNLHAATRVAVPRDFGTDSPPHPPLALRARPSPTTSKAE